MIYSLYQLPSYASMPLSASPNEGQSMPMEDDWKEIPPPSSETIPRVLMGRITCRLLICERSVKLK